MRSERNYLFQSRDWHSLHQALIQKLRGEIAGLESQRILNTPVEDLLNHFIDEYTLNVPVIQKDQAVADQREKQIDASYDYGRHWSTPGPHYIPGTEISLTVPFTGDGSLFEVQPTSYTNNPPVADVNGQTLTLRIAGTKLDPKNVRAQFDSDLGSIEGYLSTLRGNTEQWNKGIRETSRQQIEGRRTKLLADQNLVASLGFPLRKRPDAPTTFVAPQVRRKIKPALPPPSTQPFKPEPALSSDDYEHILNVLQNMALVMERSPSAFNTMDEESLRSHFLVQLNAQYEGQATGETFNHEGKTDILLRVDGRNIFIAECKFWGGPKKLVETIDQLLSYSSWRDTKTAVIVFNRRKNFSNVLMAITPALEKHPNFKRFMPISGETRFRAAFSQPRDSLRELVLTVLGFDVPCSMTDDSAED
jgi:hypothetical protein